MPGNKQKFMETNRHKEDDKKSKKKRVKSAVAKNFKKTDKFKPHDHAVCTGATKVNKVTL